MMNPYHLYDKALERTQAIAGDKQKDAMLKGFREQILALASVLDPEEKRRRMGKVVNEWVPALEDLGMVNGEARTGLEYQC